MQKAYRKGLLKCCFTLLLLFFNGIMKMLFGMSNLILKLPGLSWEDPQIFCSWIVHGAILPSLETAPCTGTVRQQNSWIKDFLFNVKLDNRFKKKKKSKTKENLHPKQKKVYLKLLQNNLKKKKRCIYVKECYGKHIF